MKVNSGFNSWNRPYLFQAMEQTLAGFSIEQRKRIISLGIGDPDIPTPEPVRRAIVNEHLHVYHGYPSSQGREDLREALAAHYQKRFGVKISRDEFYVSSGAKTDLFDLNAVFSNPGESVILMDPAYPVYRNAAEYRGNRIIYLRGSLKNGYQPGIPSDANLDNLALIYLCYPNNPTGAEAEGEYIQKMIDLAIAQDALIIMDIAYADFVPGNTPSSAFSIFSLPGGEQVGIEVGSFSKPYSMTGDRLSWVAIKNPAVASFWHQYKANRDSGASNYAQAGGLAALTDDRVKDIIRSTFEIYGRRADILGNGLDISGFEWTGLTNTPYAWFKIPVSNDAKAIQYILEHIGVIFTPGSGFGPAGRGFLRATIFQPEDRLREAMLRLQQIDFTKI
ncbi:pyridoxal phosphate-dependent aminotransferase [bacterium]|nr:pyridoxal phosphate-dependent aminotransferase [bacterium]